MRNLLLPLSLLMAAVATIGLAVLVLRDRSPAAEPVPGEIVPDTNRADVLEPLARPAGLRAYETTATLTEDLRDALADKTADVNAECWRISRRLQTKARWALENLAPHEASPRVRALLVLGTGIHVPDTDALLRYLTDRSAVVRQAAVLATGYLRKSSSRVRLMGRVDVPLGRALPFRVETRLRTVNAKEQDAGVRAAIHAVLRANSRR